MDTLFFCVLGALCLQACSGSPWPACPYNARLVATNGLKEDKVCVKEVSSAPLPGSGEQKPQSLLVDLHNVTGCEDQDFHQPPYPIAGSIVALFRGECTLLDQALAVQSRNASALLIICLDDDYANCDDDSLTNLTSAAQLNIPVAIILSEDFSEVSSTLAFPFFASLHRSYEVLASGYLIAAFVIIFILVLSVSCLLCCSMGAWFNSQMFPSVSPQPSGTSAKSPESVQLMENQQGLYYGHACPPVYIAKVKGQRSSSD